MTSQSVRINRHLHMISDCNRNYTGVQGKIKETLVGQNCYISITVPENRTISLYFDKFIMPIYVASEACSYAFLKVFDGNSSSAPLLRKVCGEANPSPVFSNSNAILLQLNTTNRIHADVDITYTSSTKPQGCGGVFFNYRGVFTSPLYPSSYRNDSECEYNVRVPLGLQVALKFTVFDIVGSCDSNYVVVTTYADNLPNEHKFCSNVSALKN